MSALTQGSLRKPIKINIITRFDELPLAHAPVAILAVVRDVLEEILVECAGGGEGAQAGGQGDGRDQGENSFYLLFGIALRVNVLFHLYSRVALDR